MKFVAKTALIASIVALFPLLSSSSAHPTTPAPVEPPEPTHIWMRNVVLFPYNDVPIQVAALSGRVRSTRNGQPVLLDDVTSYAIAVEHASIRFTADNLAALMNRRILPAANSPIKHVEVSFNDGSIAMSGTMVKDRVPVPFTATAVLAVTRDGDLRIKMTAIRSGGIVPKSVMDALGMPFAKISQPAHSEIFHVEGDDIIVPMVSMFPPPLLIGKLTALRVTRSGLLVTIGDEKSQDPPAVHVKSYLCIRGGTVMFAKLTMNDTDITLVPLDARPDLGFSPVHYHTQMEAGETMTQPDHALVARLKDFREVRITR